MQRRERSPQERLDDMERKARLRVTVLCIICAVALFIEFLLSVTLPVKVGFNVFLAFQQSTSSAVNPGFQLGLTVFTTILGILVCLGELFANFGHYQRLLLASVPVQIVFAMLNIICFVLWALVTELWGWFGAGLAFSLIAIVAAFGAALAATQVLVLPQFVVENRSAAEDRATFSNKEL